MSLVRNSLIYTLGGLLPKLVSFLMLPVVTRCMTKEDFGVVTAITTLMALISIGASLHLPGSGMFRCYFDYQNESDRRRFVGTIASSVLVVNLLVIGLCFAAAGLLQLAYPQIPFYPYYAIGLATVPLSSFVDVFQLLFRLREEPQSFVVISTAAFFFNLGFLVLWVVMWSWGAMGMLLATLAGQALTVPLAVWMARRHLILSWSRPMFMNALSFSLQSLPYILSGILMTNIDRYLVSRLSTTGELGLYGAAFRLSSVLFLLISAVGMSYDPYFMRIASSEPYPRARELLGTTGTEIIILFMLIGSGGIMFCGPVVAVMMDSSFAGAAAVLPFLIVGAVAGVGDYIGSLGTKYAKRQIWFTPVYLIACVVTAALDYQLVPRYGAVGAGMANMVCALFTMVLRFACSQKFWPVPLQYGRLVLAAMAMAGVVILSCLFTTAHLLWAVVVKTLLFVLMAMVVAYYMGWLTRLRALIFQWLSSSRNPRC